MIILGIEASAKSAGAAIVKDDKLMAETYLNNGLTHSQTVLPLTDACLRLAGLKLNDINALAVSVGPGSFTGIRIGVSAVKGLSFANNIPVYGISTLEALATGAVFEDALICPVMDARCQQVYTALFTVKNGLIQRLIPDTPLKLTELAELLEHYRDKKILLLGDGAELTLSYLNENNKKAEIFPEIYRFQHASGVAFAAITRYNNGELPVSADTLNPVYLRPSQAEREKQKKESKTS